MRFLGQYAGMDFYEYSPSLLHPYFTDYPKEGHPHYEGHVAHKIRMMIEYLRGGYRVYYMVLDGEVAGHIVVAEGGRRLKVSTERDIVLGPVFTSPSMRGRGIGTAGIRVVLNDLGLEYDSAYEFILNSNLASIRTVEKNGYVLVGHARESGPMKNMISCDDGNYSVYRYVKNK